MPLADGRDHLIEDLTSVGVPLFSCSTSGRVIMGYCAGAIKQRSECLRIVLDNEQEIVCSPSQAVMLRDGSYLSAADLRRGTSLMPLYTQRDKDGYVLVQQNYSGRWQKAHWIAARCGLLGPIPRFDGQRTVIHHKNFDEADNTPENLEFMGAHDHAAYHRSLVERNEHWQSPEFEARRVQALAAKAATVEGHAFFAERGTQNIKAYMKSRPDHFRAAVAGNGTRGAPVLAKYNKSDKGRQKSRELANAKYECEVCGEAVKSYIGLHNHRRWRHGVNHKVSAVHAHEQTLLFCACGSAGNFAVSAGIFVAACNESSQP